MEHIIPDIECDGALVEYLHATGRLTAGESPRIERLAGGVSNRTILLTRPSGEAWVLKQALPKLRVEADWFADPDRIHREALGLTWLPRLLPEGAVPKLVFEDRPNHLLAMQAVPQPHENWKTMLMRGRIEPSHVEQFGRMLGMIHRRSAASDEIAPVFEDRAYFISLRIEPYYQYAAAQVPAAGEHIAELVEQTLARRLALVHGDYSPKNILVHRDRLILLDHEVIHFGDPSFDLGFALAHFLSKAHHFPAHRQQFSEAAVTFIEAYLEELGDVPWRDEVERWGVEQGLGCLLARVAGRSPLEYLDADERRQQAEVVVEVMRRPPRSVGELAEVFLAKV